MMSRFTRSTAFVAVIALAGCLTPQDYTPVTQYTIAPDLSGLSVENGTGATLGIRRFGAAQPLKRDIFYRDPDLRVGNLLTAQWAENPADMMTRYVFDAATRSGRFKDVGLATDVAPPTYLLTGDLRRFDLDRTGETWTAVCQVHFELRTVSDSAAAWSETLTASVPLARNEVGALPQAMSDAASEVIRKALESIVGATG